MSTVFILFQPKDTRTVMNNPDKNHETVQNTLNLPPILVFDYLVHPQRILTSSKFFPASQAKILSDLSSEGKGLNFCPGGTRSKVRRRSDTWLKTTRPPLAQRK